MSDAARKDKGRDELSRNARMEWKQLRQCWLNLKDERNRHTLVEEFLEAQRQSKDPYPLRRDALAKEHRTILDALMARGQVEKPVAEHMQIAFEEAAYHVIRSGGSCYVFMPFEADVREDLIQRADALSKTSDDLDPATVAKAQAAIAQDLAFFETVKTRGDSYKGLEDHKAASLKTSPEALEAARLLTLLFVGTSD